MQPQTTTASRQPFGREMSQGKAVEPVRRQRAFQRVAAGEPAKMPAWEPIDLLSATKDPFSLHREYFRGNDYY
ncbi:MAG: hypothetical protein A3F84_05395 [Candidatus Handelsmanbacteria bacterium RIFCSPLOWO2_12_FULL_64_10]|uniref:Uncharacterized protein n=1 Tax=Handelsmanbacteria sp. (strain RIFCSPLOWO2_12_FULL_64_10) TaxID=1817868 RepID=A0A1F6CBL6_HANXR|nr:MAG: hypothetical protein A3F84_05395 [Candidatus Handelsmanbacteria bacterium RIFCSPLOWO2_12_FULL_64_10]